MLENYSTEQKKYILLKFTKELIKNSNPTEFKKVSEKKQYKIPETPYKKIQVLKPQIKNHEFVLRKTPQRKPLLKIPETRLPLQFAYLRPRPQKLELDLGKLNMLLQDPAVNIIESNGPDERIIVRGSMGAKPTQIILTKDEINQIIQTFSDKAKIPIGEGVTKIVLGRYTLSAIISEETGSRFIIKKIH